MSNPFPQPIMNPYDKEEVIGLPCWRIAAHYAYSLHEKPNFAQKIVDVLREGLEQEIKVTSASFLRPKTRRHEIKPKEWDKIREYIVGEDEHWYFRLYGEVDIYTPNLTLPLVLVEHSIAENYFLDIDLPMGPKAQEFMRSKLWSTLMTGQPNCMTFGYGILPNPETGSGFEYNFVGKAGLRYRTALCLKPVRMNDAATSSWLPESFSKRFRIPEKEINLGIYDIGWKNYLCKDFARRTKLYGLVYKSKLGRLFENYQELEAELDKAEIAVKPAENEGLEVTIGAEPIWGDVNYQEDITNYQLAHKYLEPAWTHETLYRFCLSMEEMENEEIFSAYRDRLK